jgi:hypothetical protein
MGIAISYFVRADLHTRDRFENGWRCPQKNNLKQGYLLTLGAGQKFGNGKWEIQELRSTGPQYI